MIKKFGFTLAEVLITLGIIGVVAAMTIPTLINTTNQAEFKTGIKKAVSVLNQAVTMNVAIDSVDFSGLLGGNTANSATVYNMINSRMNVVSTGNNATIGGAFNNGALNYTMYFNDGMIITFPTNSANCTTTGAACRIVVDLNGVKKPNTLSTATTTGQTITDQFVLDFYNQQVLPHGDRSRWVLYN